MPGMERRKHTRARINKDVRINDKAGLGTCIGKGGIYILTNQEFQPNSQVMITLTMDRGLLAVPGVVRYFHADVGMGVMFLNPTDDQCALLRQIVESAQASEQKKTAPTVLLVDNNVIKRKTYAQVLARSGYIVHETGSDIEAIEYLRTKPAQAVIFDPFIQNGFTLLQRIRLLPDCRSIFPIVLASRNIPEDKKRMHLQAVREVLVKMTTPPLRLQKVLGKYLPI